MEKIAEENGAELHSELSLEQSRALFKHIGIPLVSQSETAQNNWLRKQGIYIGIKPQHKYPFWCN